MNRRLNKIKQLWLFLLMCTFILCISPEKVYAKEDKALEYNSLEELKNASEFGVVTGTVFDEYTKELNPKAKISYYNSITDAALALEDGKIDAFLFDKPSLEFLCSQYDNLGIISENYIDEGYHFCLQKNDKGEKLQKEFNEWLAQKKSKGELQEIIDFWCSTEDPEGRIDLSTLSGEKGTLNAVTSVASRPDNFYYKDNLAGIPVDVVVTFARECGYDIKISVVNIDAMMPSLISGKADLCVGMYSKTEEREKMALFTDSYYEGGISVVVRAADQENSATKGMFHSFRRTLIDEERWKLILKGLSVTLIITILGFLLANVLGALFCAMAMSHRRILRGIAEIYSRIMQGTPSVVILMILYYVIFGKIEISGIIVAIIGFGLSTGAYLAQQFKGNIEGVEKGQMEAALAIGFTKEQAFLGIVLPQAIRTMLPGYFSELISLMKGTAIVGYIAVSDLTKSGDIIRSSTFEPFFPLLVVALIYFVIACALLSILKRIQKKLAPKRVQMKKVGEKHD